MLTKRIADRVIKRLEDFNRSLRAGEDIEKKYTTRTVRLNLERRAPLRLEDSPPRRG